MITLASLFDGIGGALLCAERCGLKHGTGGLSDMMKREEIDKISIKPKRNIDHIIELWDAGKADTASDFWNSIVCKQGSVIGNMLSPYTEPIKLTAEERKALELVKACGYDLLWYDACYLWAHVRGENEAKVAVLPSILHSLLCRSIKCSRLRLMRGLALLGVIYQKSNIASVVFCCSNLFTNLK